MNFKNNARNENFKRSGGEKKGWDRIKGGGRQVKDGGPLSYDALAKTLILFLSYPYIWPTLLQVL